VTLPLAKLEGKYEILQKIQEGGMGAIYKVRHLLLDEVRVVKVMKPQLAVDDKLKRRFVNEAKLAKRLRASNIAQLYDFVLDDDGVAYIVMEYIDGVTLQELLRQGGPPSVGFAVEAARQGLRALSCLHHEGMVHRDIAADNLMITKNFDRRPLVKLIDLGIAKDARAVDGGGTAAGTFLGKARYSAPEQFSEEGSAALGPRSDLYSFGVLLYELLTAESPIGGKSFSELVASHLFRPPKSFDKTDPERRIEPALRELVLNALEKDPANRMASAEEFSDLLAPFQSGEDLREELEARLTLAKNAGAAQDFSDPGSSQSKLKKAFPSKKQTTPPAAPYPRPVSDDGQERHRQLVQTESQVRQLLKAGQLDEAEAALTSAVAKFGQDRTLDALRRKLEEACQVQHERRDGVRAKAEEHSDVKSEVERLLDQGMIEEAERRLAGAEQEHRRQAEVRDRSQGLSNRAREALVQHRFDEARQLVAEALEVYAENERAKELQASIAVEERRYRLAETCRAIAGEIDADRLDQAAQQLQAAEGQFGRDAELDELRSRIEGARRAKAERAIEEAVRSIEAAIGSHDFASAEKRLSSAVVEHGSDPRFVKLRSELEREREEETRRAVAAAVGTIRQLLEGGKLDEAQQQLQAASAKHGSLQELEKLDSRLAELRREKKQRQAVAREVESILALLGKGKLERADKQLKGALSRFGDDRDLTDLRSKVDSAIQERELRLERERGGREAEAREREERKAERKRRPAPDTGEFTKLRRQLDAAREKKRQAAVTEIKRSMARGRWDEAKGRLSNAVSELGAHAELEQLASQLARASKAPVAAPGAPVDRTMVLPGRTVPIPIPETEEKRKRGIRPLVAGGVAVVLVVAAVAAWLLIPGGTTVVGGTLILDATPGTEITAIVGEDGSSHMSGQVLHTPLHLQLEPGLYKVALAYRDQVKRVEIEIRSGEITEPATTGFSSELSAAEYFELEKARVQDSR